MPESVRTLRHDGVHYAQLRDAGAWSEITSAVRAGEHEPVALDLHELLRSGSSVPSTRRSSRAQASARLGTPGTDHS